MPISTSPYQGNDYQAASIFQPYQLPTQQIARTALALDSFWKAGAARVKNAYDSALDLQLTSNENRLIQKKFMEDAQQKLTKLASMDLSDPSVQRQGLGIFQPIFQDEPIMKDDHLTRLKQSIYSDADSYRRDQKTKGAGFHIDNLAYALRPFRGFNSNTTRDQIGDIFEGAQGAQYIPFYDDSKEKLSLLKACGGDKMSNTISNGAYMHTVSDASLTESKLWGCLDAGLSGEARQQNRISATVRYGDDYHAVRQDYIDSATGQLKHYQQEKALLEAKQAALQKAPDSQDKTDGLLALKGMIDTYDQGITHVNEQLNGSAGVLGYNQWTDQYVKDHYEDLASTAFFKKSNQAFASAFAHQDKVEADKANPIYVMQYVQNEENRRAVLAQEGLNTRQQSDFQHDIDLENLKFQHKLLSGDETGKGKDPLTAIRMCATTQGCDLSKIGSVRLSAITEDPTTSQKLQAQITDLEGSKAKTIKDLANDPAIGPLISHLGLNNVGDYNSDDFKDRYNKMQDVLNTYANDALAKDKNDVTALKIVDATNKLLQIDNEKGMLKGVYDDAVNATIKNNPKLTADDIEKRTRLRGDIVKQFKPVKVGDETIDGQRMLQIFDGTDSRFELDYTNYKGALGTVKDPQVIDKSTGKTVNVDLLRGAQGTYYGEYIGNETDFQKALNTEIAGNTLVQHMGLALGNIFTKGSVQLQNLETMFGQGLGVIDDNQPGPGKVVFSSGSVDPVTGEVIVEASGTGSGGVQDKKTYSEMRDVLAKNGVANGVYSAVPGNKYQIKLTLPATTGLIQAPTYGDKIRQQLNYFETKTGSLPPGGVVIKVGKAKDGTLFSVRLNREIGGDGPSYTLIASGLDKDGKLAEKEVPFKNAGGVNDKENIIVQLNKALTGQLDKSNAR